MTNKPYFMSNESWYAVDENGDLILTKNAPKEAIADYNKYKQEYIKKIEGMSNEEYLEYLMEEDNDWMTFPVE
jgi:hypothetical protein